MNELVTNTVRILQGKPELKIIQDRYDKIREQNPKLASGLALPEKLFRKVDARSYPYRVELIARAQEGEDQTNLEDEKDDEEDEEDDEEYEDELNEEELEELLAEAELEEAELDPSVTEQATTTTRRKTILAFGKSGHQLKAIFAIFLDLAGDLLPAELVHLYQMLARVDNIIAAPTFPFALLKELEQLTQLFYDTYEKFMDPHRVPVPPSFRRLMSLAELIAFSGPPATGTTRSWKSRHVILRDPEATSEAQALQALMRRSLFSMPALRRFTRYPREKLSNARVWSDLTLPVKTDLPPSQVQALRRWYSEELAEPGLDPSSLSWSGFKSAFLGQRAVTEGSYLLIEEQSSKRVQLIRVKSFWRISRPDNSRFDYFVLGQRFSLPASVTTAADLFKPEFNLRHTLVPHPGPPVLLPFCRSPAPRLRGSPLLYDLLFRVDAPLSFEPGSATVDAKRAVLNLQALPDLALTSANSAYFYKADRHSLNPGDTQSAEGTAPADPDKLSTRYGCLLSRARVDRDYDSFRTLTP